VIFLVRFKDRIQPSIRAGLAGHHIPHTGAITIKNVPHLQRRHQLKLAQERLEYVRLDNLSLTICLLSSTRWFLTLSQPAVGLNRAPSGTIPCSTYFHSAINSLRAKATIPMRRMRLPP
jgi:hypothetical protein